MNTCRAMFASRTSMVLFVVLALFTRLAEAQLPGSPGAPSDRDVSEGRKNLDQAVIRHLRDGQIETALKSLESVGDRPTALSFVDENGLSSACACLHRALSQLDSETQFDLLSKWSMPADQPPRIRFLMALVPTSAPPAGFARGLGERPRNQSFPVSSIGEVKGVFCSGWNLVLAGRDCGRLKKFMADLGPLVDKKVPNAELLMALAQIVDGRSDMTKLAGQFSQRIASIKAASTDKAEKLEKAAPGTVASTTDPVNVVLAAASLQHPALRPFGEELFSALVANTKGQAAPRVRPFLQQAYVTAVLLGHDGKGEHGAASVLTSRFKYWVPVSSNPPEFDSPEPMDSVWLNQENHLLRASGSENDSLLLRFPLAGHFQFECETEFVSRSQTDGGLIFGGLGYRPIPASEELRITDARGSILEKRPCPFFPKFPTKAFNRLTITSTPASSVMAVNLHPIWTDNSGFEASPWLGLSSFDEFRAQFRNVKLTGQPVIPRSVRLVDGQILRGWISHAYGGRSGADIQVNDWQIADGLLRTSKRAPTPSREILERLLAYQRPLLDGESVSFEFFYEPGIHEICPAIGRMAFLVQPEGVRIHWVTDGDRDWTGLGSDNVVTEPLHRRGPRQLPLKSNDWNRLTLSKSKGSVSLSLGDVIIYERPIDWIGDQRFGFYRPKLEMDAQIRNVVMTGDWPDRLPQKFLDDPTATDLEPRTIAQVQRISRLFREQFFADNVIAIRRKALTMSLEERFEFLSEWIMPGKYHTGIRMSGDFTPTKPSPPAFEGGVEHPEQGGQVVSPVFDWLDAARELGRLADCRRHVETIASSDNEFQRRAKASLLLLIGLEQHDAALIDSAWESLFGLLKNEVSVEDENHWPEMLLATRGCERFLDNTIVSELIADLVLQRMLRWKQPDLVRWHNHLASLHGQMLAQRLNRAANGPEVSTELREWIPVAAGRAFTFGSGFANLRWIRHDNKVVKVTPHDADFLFYQLPLGGNFEVEANLVQPGSDPVAVIVAGSYVGPIWGLDRLDTGTFRAGAPHIQLTPALTNLSKPVRFRAVVQDGVRTIYLNGRKILETPLLANFDPWIAIRSPGRHLGSVTDLRIKGQPKVLDEVPLATTDLNGWVNYHEESWWEFVDKSDATREPDLEKCLIGHRSSARPGSSVENLLRYQRPLVEDGSIDYEFFYEPGAIEVHPALDRLAFVLQPSGVREHWITDGQYDRTDVAPTNMIEVPANKRGPAELPLKSGQWNRLSLTLRGSTVSIRLNGMLVYERGSEPFNRRAFGLFHFADATQARARNIVMRGDWPKTLPPLSAQELAGKTTDWIDADLPRLKSLFTHSFEKEGLPEEYFELSMPSPMKLTKDGVHAAFTSDTDALTYEIQPRFSVSGDFDLEASFSQVHLEARKQYCGILLRTVFDDPQKPCYDLHRIMTHLPQQLSQSSVAFTEPVNPGASLWRAEVNACETDSGRLRLARRGKKLFYLFAEGDSDTFHLFGTETVSQSDLIRQGVRLQMFAFGGKTEAIWRNISLRAERMTWFPVPSKSNVIVLKIIQTDGTGLRTFFTPSLVGFTHVGSPEWSADGQKIAMDVSNGGTETSHIFVANADGTAIKDLGMGCMPSFSADGSRLAFSQPGQGIMTMKSDGSDRQVVDRSGWGTQWSPDGKWIAYGKAGNITVVNVTTKQSRQLLTGDAAGRYSYIYWNLGWSHDSRAVAFKAQRSTTNQQEIAVAEIDSPGGFKVLQQDASATHPDVSFSPENEQVTVAINNAGGRGHRLHAISRKQPGLPQLVKTIPANQVVDGVSWSHDGKAIVFAALQIAEPTEWVTGMKSNTFSK